MCVLCAFNNLETFLEQAISTKLLLCLKQMGIDGFAPYLACSLIFHSLMPDPFSFLRSRHQMLPEVVWHRWGIVMEDVMSRLSI